jgi:hemolysin activation/secretion protein
MPAIQHSKPRRRAALSRKAATLPLVALGVSLLAGPARAQRAQVPSAGQLPNAGQLLEETRRANTPPLPTAPVPRLIDPPVRPTVTMPEGVTVAVSDFRITGAASFPIEKLAELVKPWVGKRLDIAGLNEAAGAITRHYQAAGHLLSYAYLPAQRVADGVIELAVLEGRLDGMQIVAAQDVRLRDEVVQAHTESLSAPGPVLQTNVERQLLLLNDIPGVTARAAFTPGATTGTADVVVSVAEDDPLEVRGDFDNHGSKSSGEYRAGINVQLRDLFGWGDVTTAHALVSNKGGLVSGSLGTSVPVGGDGYKVGANLSHLTYELNAPFNAAGAVGTADVLGVDASYPFLRTADANIGARLGFEYQKLNDELRLLGTFDKRHDKVAMLTGTFDLRDSYGGVSAGSVTGSLGMLTQETPSFGLVTKPIGTTEWHKLGAQAARQQAISGPWSVYGRIATQYTTGNLDSSQKMGLGGAGGVRSYAPGEASVDVGTLLTLELRYGLDLLGGGIVASLFTDQATGRISRYPLADAGNDVRMSGTGLGLTWNGGGVGVNGSLAWRGSRVPTADGSDPKPRLFLQMFITP